MIALTLLAGPVQGGPSDDDLEGHGKLGKDRPKAETDRSAAHHKAGQEGTQTVVTSALLRTESLTAISKDFFTP